MTRTTTRLSRSERLLGGVRLEKILSLLLILLFTGGCASGYTGGESVTSQNDWRGAAYFVERQPKDGRGLAGQIVTALNARGLQAQEGDAGGATQDVSYLVRYVDQWGWDMRMYLSSLKIELRDPKTQAIIGYGQSVQNSLKAMGQTHEDIIEAALAELFAEVGSTTASEEGASSDNQEQ